MISALPLAFRVGASGMVALFRFGVAVLVGLSPLEEEDTLAKLKQRSDRRAGADRRRDGGSGDLADLDDVAPPGGPIQMKDLSPQRFLVLADALAKTVALARDEREVNAVFDVIEPFAATLARSGRPPFRRRAMLRLIGQALLAQHRVSGRVAVEEKPDVLWDRPDLERLYARLEDEYELKERGEAPEAQARRDRRDRARADRHHRRRPRDEARSDHRRPHRHGADRDALPDLRERARTLKPVASGPISSPRRSR